MPTGPIGDAARPGADAEWTGSAERFADRVEATIEAHAPGFRDRILARRIWTPADLEAANANVLGGDINAGSFAIDQQLLFRPGLDWWRWARRSRACIWPGRACREERGCMAPAAT